MKHVIRLALWLLLAVAIVPLGSCAQLALLPSTTQFASLAGDLAFDPATPDSHVDVIINVAPTPALPEIAPTPTVVEVPTVTPQPQPPATVKAVVARPLPTNSCRANGQLVRGKWASKVFSRSQEYALYLPPCYDEEGNTARYPVIYLFHGWPMDENHWITLGVVGAADRLINAGELPPFIIALPRGDKEGIYNRTSGGDKSFEGAIANEFIPFIDRKYRTLRQSDYRAIGGISRGGVWALEIAFRHPDMFSSVGAHSAALGVNQAAADFDPFDLAPTAPIESLRFFIDSGASDWTRTTSAQLSKILEARHIPHTYTTAPGDHLDSYWSTQVEAYLKFYAAPWKAEKVAQQQLTSQTP
ncbi:MAG TPA: alpha/beta hydrolase-fold protein [Anaerolineae bacterium]|nr:alpha/beta hydrolase-fold protein [Anaerolineae bacterium]